MRQQGAGHDQKGTLGRDRVYQGFKVQGLGLRVLVQGVRKQGKVAGLWKKGSEFMVYGSQSCGTGFRAHGINLG